MRDLLEDLDAAKQFPDPDPVRRAQLKSKMPLPKRFYAEVGVDERDGGHAVLLDGKPVRTPGRAVLLLPTQALARLVADEFASQGTEIDPATMPVTRLANPAVDGVSAEAKAVADEIVKYAGTDLLFYRASGPQPLVDRQVEAWDPVLDWFRRHLGTRFLLAEGVMHVEQPKESIDAIRRHVDERTDPFRIAAMHVMTTLTGSALLALAVEAGAWDVDTAWAAAHVDEDWNIENWGTDAEAQARRSYRKADMMASARTLAALAQP